VPVAQPGQLSLLTQRRFAPFFATQFLGAFNDNVFRNGLIILITFHGASVFGLNASQLANTAGALFILPFILFSAPAGQLADKYEKSRLIRSIKLIEIGLMILAAYAFYSQSFGLLLLLLFLMGCQSTLFGPVKYAYLPQKLAVNELIGGNALVESGTYLAIILGLVGGGLLVALDPSGFQLLAACLLATALLGYAVSRSIPETPAADASLALDLNLTRETRRIIAFAREDRSVFLSILGISWFWCFGSAMTLQIPAYTQDILRSDEATTTVLLVAFAIGVGIGSLLCEKLSKRRVELGLVPFGSIGLTLFAVDLYFAAPTAATNIAVASVADFVARPGSIRILIDLALLGAFGGFYSVPLYALVQQRADPKKLSRIIAANNIINSLFIVAAAILAILFLSTGLSIPQFFLLLAILNALVAVYIYRLLPEFLMRFFAWVIVNTLYRIKTSGIENIPANGPAILVCNHVSYVDAFVIGGSIPRPVRFVMWYRIFELPVMKFLFRGAKAIPIASAKEDSDILDNAFVQIEQELSNGQLVCIFPEGAITRDGDIQTFRPGIEKIVGRNPVPVIPLALGGLWGSWFSRKTDGGLRRLPGKLLARVHLRAGQPVAAKEVRAVSLELLVRTLRGQNR